MTQKGKQVVWAESDYKKFESLCAIQCTQQEICSIMEDMGLQLLYRQFAFK